MPVAALLLAAAQPFQPGSAYRIVTSREATGHTNDGSSSSSSDRDTTVERVIAVTPDGVTLEYDFSPDTSDAQRASTWQLPARVFRPAGGGPLRLVDETAMVARVDRWLRRAKLTRAACGRLIFTWNAFRIECDPSTVLALVDRLTLPDSLRDGIGYIDPDMDAPVTLKKHATASGPPHLHRRPPG